MSGMKELLNTKQCKWKQLTVVDERSISFSTCHLFDNISGSLYAFSNVVLPLNPPHIIFCSLCIPIKEYKSKESNY